jgi:hypothetical protein
MTKRSLYASAWEAEMYTRFWLKTLKGRAHLKTGLNWRTIIKWRKGTQSLWLKMLPVAGYCEHSNKQHKSNIKLYF